MYFFKKSIITRIPPGGRPALAGDSPDRIPYLIRWTLFGCKWFTIKVHKILISDESCMHDHPFSFVSLILWGGYTEEQYVITRIGWAMRKYPQGQQSGFRTFKKWYRPGSILWRPSHIAHRLELTKPCWTLVVTFKKVQEWGFFTGKGWVKWDRYVASNTCE